MASLTVRNVDKKVLPVLKKRAQAHCISQSEECRRILEDAAKPVKKARTNRKKTYSFKERLLNMPELPPKCLPPRHPGPERKTPFLISEN